MLAYFLASVVASALVFVVSYINNTQRQADQSRALPDAAWDALKCLLALLSAMVALYLRIHMRHIVSTNIFSDH